MKLAVIASDAEMAQEELRSLEKTTKFVPVKEADTIVALGGDGLMIRALHECVELGKPVYGLNCGTVGFLMNQLGDGELIHRVSEAMPTCVYPLLMEAVTTDGKKILKNAFNEVSVLRFTHQTANLKLMVNGVTRIPKLMCDGILVATPMGSTAYNLSARGPVIPLGSEVLALTPVSPFRPRRWHGALLPSSAVVELINLDPVKRPLGASADFHEVHDVASLTIREDRTKPIQILFDPGQSLEERILSEQFEN